jgi:hypothetical protein
VDDTFGHGLAQAGVAPQVNFRLIRLRGRTEQSLHAVKLTAGRYDIHIANDNLLRVQIEVFDQNGYRSDLSQSIRFRPTMPTEASILLTAGEGLLELFFVPEGPVNGSANIAIHKY